MLTILFCAMAFVIGYQVGGLVQEKRLKKFGETNDQTRTP